MSWWIIVTAPACEQRVVRDLGEAGFEAWTPTRLVKFRCRHMRHAVERAYPSFPNYAFVVPGSDPDETWHRLRAVDGVRAILCNTGRPLQLADAEMARVRDHLDGIASKPVDADVWRKDDRARISDGPFMGNKGVVVDTAHLAKRGSITLLLMMFGREVRVEHLVEQLERAA